MDDYDDYDYDDDAEEDDDMLLPPSPPRSPPRDLDPDKLYGLYDFSGPDPLHCSLLRDEPVVLINDSDNYWWLIKKLTKQERFELSRSKHLTYNLDDDFDDFDDFSDSEDGKIGFVPAECLETYGERLARLNCFKNEALEKSSKEDINDTTLSYADDFNLGLNLSNPINFQSDDNLSKSTVGSLKRKKSTKSVTFEDLGELVLDDDTNDLTTSIHKNNDDDFHNSYFDIPRDEIRDVIKNNPKEPSETSNSEDKKLEVLSDVYPTETPLIINKNNRSGQNSQDSPPLDGSSPKDPIRIISDNEPIITHVVDLNEKSNQQKSEVAVKSEENLSLSNANKNTHLDKPSMSTSNQEIISIGSFSPDTPRESSRNKKSNKKSISSPPSCPSSANSSTSPANRSIDDEASQFRRSLILDRLNQVTFDIQEQLNLSDEDLDHFSHYYRPDNLTFGADLKHSPEQHRMIHDVINQSDLDSDQPSDLDLESFVNSSSNHTNSRDLSNKHHRHNGHHNHHHHSSISQDQDLSVTPLTSLNSLSNGINSTTMTQFSNTSNSKAYYNNIHAIIPEDEDITVSPTPHYPSSLPESQTNPDFIPKASDIPLSERRKSKPVHDMFLPILGKFDDLAEKLAELEDFI
ncbi:hypothetical protein QCA50_016837 [Cerrena zonata]|uniref:SH3 domain-containing protein n=1 Tax=Cerrena zonata TaxID=2478898 RepID=A0AAW0FS41_9APHY